MNKTKTVIFGGSFDPIHKGHVALAEEVCRRKVANEVWFLVSPQNPHKAKERLSPEALRLQMVKLAVAHNPCLKACDFEFFLPRPSYTVNTLAALSEAYPDREFILLIGADNWQKFDKWHKWEEILANYKIVVYPRGEGELLTALPRGVEWIDAPLFDVSSTQVREIISSGGDASSLLSPNVQEFIKKNGLYKKEFYL